LVGVKDLRGPFAAEVGFMQEIEVGFMPGRLFLLHKAYFGLPRWRTDRGSGLTLLTGLTLCAGDAALPCPAG
jgi:hypothetical protein